MDSAIPTFIITHKKIHLICYKKKKNWIVQDGIFQFNVKSSPNFEKGETYCNCGSGFTICHHIARLVSEVSSLSVDDIPYLIIPNVWDRVKHHLLDRTLNLEQEIRKFTDTHETECDICTDQLFTHKHLRQCSKCLWMSHRECVIRCHKCPRCRNEGSHTIIQNR